ncbi:MAG: cbb3-type cytochrome oxidase assembly protein CcoS [Candidatus Azosocius agrarius]|nr:MAG: cbb3-type cytochrome oxidase assembly protein CcoS [Gammaproteobacteria bacterium]
MSIIFLLIPVSLVLLVISIYFFWWAVDNNQFDNLENISNHILLNDDYFDK